MLWVAILTEAKAVVLSCATGVSYSWRSCRRPVDLGSRGQATWKGCRYLLLHARDHVLQYMVSLYDQGHPICALRHLEVVRRYFQFCCHHS